MEQSLLFWAAIVQGHLVFGTVAIMMMLELSAHVSCIIIWYKYSHFCNIETVMLATFDSMIMLEFSVLWHTI